MGLSPIMMQKIMETIVELKASGTTILLVEQNAQAALSLADQGHVMEVGKIVLSGTGARTSSTTSRSARPTSARTEQHPRTTRRARPRVVRGRALRPYARTGLLGSLLLLLLGVLDHAPRRPAASTSAGPSTSSGSSGTRPARRARTPSAGCSSPGPPASGSPAAARGRRSRFSSAFSSVNRETAISMAGHHVALAERLHQIRHRPGVPGPLDEVALREGGEHQHGGDGLLGDLLGGGDPVEDRHLHVEDAPGPDGARAPVRRPAARPRPRRRPSSPLPPASL